MKRNRHRLSRFVAARTFWVRAVAAWRELLPDWKPTLQALEALDNMPMNHQRAVRVVAYGWDHNDPRWDVLMALLEWERRNAAKLAVVQSDIVECEQLDDNVISMDVEYERMRYDSEITVETGLPVLKKREGDGGSHPSGLPADRVASTTSGNLPGLREVLDAPQDVLADGEPVQPGPADGTPEGGAADPEGSAGTGAGLVRRPARVLSLREAKAYKPDRGDE